MKSSILGTWIVGMTLLMLASVESTANSDKARTAYNKCLSELATAQRQLDRTYGSSNECNVADGTVCVTIDIGGASTPLGTRKTFDKGDECMLRLEIYEEACDEANQDCAFKTFNEVYTGN